MYEDELLDLWLTWEKLRVYSQEHFCVDREISTDWLKDTLVPELKVREVVHGYSRVLVAR
jgi:hypothetical protein